MKEKKGILLTAFGTTIDEAAQTYKVLEARFRLAFPEFEIRIAYTSSIVRKRLKARGIDIPSPARALAQFGEDGFSEVCLQSLHVIGGNEYNDIVSTVIAMQSIPKGVERIVVGEPLLWNHEDYTRVANILHDYVSHIEEKPDSLLLMGHGTSHPANISYAALQEYFRRLNGTPVYVATLEAFPYLEDVTEELRDNGIKDLLVMPLLTVSGGHAITDLAGTQKESWKSRLQAEGFTVRTVKQALGDLPEIVDIWIEKAAQAIKKDC